jgi:hypothetical protein
MFKYLCIILAISIITVITYKYLYGETFDSNITYDVLKPDPKLIEPEAEPQYYEKWDTGRRMFDSLTYDFSYLKYYS